jgi:peptide/nickel transport system permease protein
MNVEVRSAPIKQIRPAAPSDEPGALASMWSYGLRNPRLLVGIALMLALALFVIGGSLVVDLTKAQPLSGIPDMPPSAQYLLGTDTSGREILAAMIVGTPLTLKIGLIAAVIGLSIGIVLGLSAGYFGGRIDATIRSVADIILPIPALAVLVVIASVINTSINANMMALIVASLAWMWPTRTIRAQVLSMRERGYIEVARLCGLNGVEIVIREIMPNLLPYLAASFVSATGSAILAAIGLEALGLGPQNDPTLGMTIFWANYYGAIVRGEWWWWMPPIVVIVVVFVGLFLVSAGLDEVATLVSGEPRDRRRPPRPGPTSLLPHAPRRGPGG